MAKTIYIYDSIGNSYYSYGYTARQFIREFDAAKKEDNDIEIRINSPGGSVFDGTAIFNKIALEVQAGVNVTTINDGICYSMAAVILCAGKKVMALKNATTMIHNASGGVYGNANDLDSAKEMLIKLDGAMADSIGSKTGDTKEQVTTKYFDYKDHTMSADEALEAKIIDEIIPLKSEKVPENIATMSYDDVVNWFAENNTSSEKKEQGFLDKITSNVREIFAQNKAEITPKPIEQTNLNPDMKIKILASMAALTAALGVAFAQGETEKEFEFTSEHASKLNDLMTTATANLDAANASKTTAETALTDLQTKYDAVNAELTGLKEKTTADPKSKGTPDDDKTGEEVVSEFYSEADEELKQMRAKYNIK